MDKTILIALAVIGAILFFGLVAPQPQAPPTVEQGQLIDSGEFVVEQAGQQIINEQYTLFFSPAEGYMLISQETMSVSGQNITLAQQYEFDRDFMPVLYHLAADTPSGSQIISAQMGIKGLHMETRVGTARQEADIPGKDIVILDNNLISHYAVLFLAIQAGAIPAQFTAAVPQALLSLPAKVNAAQPITFTSADKSYDGQRYDLHLGDLVIIMLSYQGKLVGVINDAQGVHAYNAQAFPSGIALPGMPAPEATTEGVVEKNMTFESGDATLAGTLTLPAGATGPVPGVLFIAGSGPVDRDENAAGLKTDVFRQLAASLAKAGIGSLRYDKRGVGQSEGVFANVSMEDLLADARAALSGLKSSDGIDPQQVFLLGHSEGGILAPIIATENSDLEGVVLLAAPAHSLDWVIRKQIERLNRDMDKSEDEVQTALAQEDQYLDFVRNSTGDWSDYTFEQLVEAMPWLTQEKYIEVKILSLSWLRQHFQHDPIESIGKVTCPVLIVQGEKDYQVPEGEADLLASALKEAGNTDVTVDKFPDLNHLMRHHPEAANLTYRHLSEPVDARVTEEITTWIAEHVAK
ncbi:MAG: alpha/beta fold hydrolase [Candidatus Bipolaricaulota bacterium]|nr:alpha/beta fold hydrolase [Candidatus Bipolaricaulota bacterium]